MPSCSCLFGLDRCFHLPSKHVRAVVRDRKGAIRAYCVADPCVVLPFRQHSDQIRLLLRFILWVFKH
jgi:hypothetical protein